MTFAKSSLRLVLCVLLLLPSRGWAQEAPHSVWEPRRTWVFAVSCTVWKFDRSANMPPDGREDSKLIATFKSRGVPEDHIVFLKDQAGTLARIQSSFTELLGKTRPGDTLIFYFQGHGSRDVDGTKSTYYFLNYDCTNARDDSFFYVKDVFDTIEQHFKGARVLLTADCCCSGGLAVEARKRRTSIGYACLTSTFAHNGSTGAWTYTDSLIRGFSASPLVDLNGDSRIGLTELADYTEQRMAVVESQKAVFATFNGFDPHMEIARLAAPRSNPRLGHFIEARWDDGKWYKGEIDNAKDGKFHIAYFDGDKKWVTPKEIRPYTPKEWPKGTAIEARNESAKDRWQPAVVLMAFHGLHLVHFNGQDSNVENQWMPPDRIRVKK